MLNSICCLLLMSIKVRPLVCGYRLVLLSAARRVTHSGHVTSPEPLIGYLPEVGV